MKIDILEDFVGEWVLIETDRQESRNKQKYFGRISSHDKDFIKLSPYVMINSNGAGAARDACVELRKLSNLGNERITLRILLGRGAINKIKPVRIDPYNVDLQTVYGF